jgi:ABC-type nickel/cobalt efflux system permease component RcnA
MGGIDQGIAGLGHGAGPAVALLVALMLGLRHASDPDHLTAVCTLVASDSRDGVRRARRLGIAWGGGHAVTLIAFGLPVLLVGSHLPGVVQAIAEFAVGLLIVVLALRLLRRWRSGYFHAHEHRHGTVVHAHPHVHEREPVRAHPRHHDHMHPERLGRSPAAAFGVGMVHGVGGSAAVAILLVGATMHGATAAAALLVFAAATAVSMAVLSTAFATALVHPRVWRRIAALAPIMGITTLAFGLSYGLVAAQGLGV